MVFLRSGSFAAWASGFLPRLLGLGGVVESNSERVSEEEEEEEGECLGEVVDGCRRWVSMVISYTPLPKLQGLESRLTLCV